MFALTVPKVIARSAATLLIVGAALGAGLFGVLMLRAESLGASQFLVAGVIVLFAVSGVVGIFLWRCSPAAIFWAIIAFFVQIPAFEIGGFKYEYFTGLAAYVLHGPEGISFTFRAGASASMDLGGGPSDFVFGVNILALAVVFALAMLARPNNSPELAPEV